MHGLIFETSICYWQDQPGSPLEKSDRSIDRECDDKSGTSELQSPLRFHCFNGDSISSSEFVRSSRDDLSPKEMFPFDASLRDAYRHVRAIIGEEEARSWNYESDSRSPSPPRFLSECTLTSESNSELAIEMETVKRRASGY
jgi:hypothetical protein